jgi:hypothetical protein
MHLIRIIANLTAEQDDALTEYLRAAKGLSREQWTHLRL